MGPTWLKGLFLLLLLFKKAEIDSARDESYSSSPPLEDCILPLLLESIFIQEKERETKRERRKRKQRYVCSEIFADVTCNSHTQAHFKKGEKEPPKQSMM
jgi:hypothetical protein